MSIVSGIYGVTRLLSHTGIAWRSTGAHPEIIRLTRELSLGGLYLASQISGHCLWDEAKKAEDDLLAGGLLDKAIGAYLKGFESDWRDAYPGINAVTLMELRDPPDPRRLDLIPVVRYSVERRIAKGNPDYWDHATLLELAMLAADQQKATAALGDSLAAVRELFEPDTTARNLSLIVEAKKKRNELPPWMEKIVQQLAERANPKTAPG